MKQRMMLSILALGIMSAGAETLKLVGYQVRTGDISFFLSLDGEIERIIMPPGVIRKDDEGRIDEAGGAKVRWDDDGRIESVDGERIRRDDYGRITDIGTARIKRDDDGKIYSIDGARIRRDKNGMITDVDQNNTRSVRPVFRVVPD